MAGIKVSYIAGIKVYYIAGITIYYIYFIVYLSVMMQMAITNTGVCVSACFVCMCVCV